MKKLLIVLAISFGMQTVYADQDTELVDGATAMLEGAAWVTTDLDASIDFYTKFLGYTQYKRVKFSSKAVLDTYGVQGERELEYAALLPANWSKETSMPGLNFIEILDAQNSKMEQNAMRGPIVGEVVTAYLVTNLSDIERAMRSAKVPFVTGLTPSSTGKSVTLTVLDPNGVRVQLYEYVK